MLCGGTVGAVSGISWPTLTVGHTCPTSRGEPGPPEGGGMGGAQDARETQAGRWCCSVRVRAGPEAMAREGVTWWGQRLGPVWTSWARAVASEVLRL